MQKFCFQNTISPEILSQYSAQMNYYSVLSMKVNEELSKDIKPNEQIAPVVINPYYNSLQSNYKKLQGKYEELERIKKKEEAKRIEEQIKKQKWLEEQQRLKEIELEEYKRIQEEKSLTEPEIQINYYKSIRPKFDNVQQLNQTLMKQQESMSLQNQLGALIEQNQDVQQKLLKKQERTYYQNLQCKNIKLLESLAPSIITLFEIYYDDIYELLIDEILEKEVVFLNELEGLKSKNAQIIDSTQEQNIKNVFAAQEQVNDNLVIAHPDLSKLINQLDNFIDE